MIGFHGLIITPTLGTQQKNRGDHMAKIGYGYGSECHLLRWMGRHRQAFNRAVLKALEVNSDGNEIDWLDFGFCDDIDRWYDKELTGLEFISDENILDVWSKEWPQRGKKHNWDAVGMIKNTASPDQQDFVLIEAKAHIGEINTETGASASDSIQRIEKVLKETASNLNATYDREIWTKRYYQHANRLAVYNHLKQRGLNPYLLFVYFIGDMGNKSRICPQEVSGWHQALSKLDSEMGITDLYQNENVKKLFLSISDDKYGWVSTEDSSKFII